MSTGASRRASWTTGFFESSTRSGFVCMRRFASVVERLDLLFEVLDELAAIARALIQRSDRVHLQAYAFKTQLFPERGGHDDDFRIDVRPREPQRLDAELVELAVAAFLRALVAVHRARVPEAHRAVVDEAVLDGRAHRGSRGLGAQRELLAVQLVGEGVHLLLDDVGDLADRAAKQTRVLEQRRADVAVAVADRPVTNDYFEGKPALRRVGQNVVHATDGLEGRGHCYADFLIGM